MYLRTCYLKSLRHFRPEQVVHVVDSDSVGVHDDDAVILDHPKNVEVSF
jgi:hypothetical protein